MSTEAGTGENREGAAAGEGSPAGGGRPTASPTPGQQGPQQFDFLNWYYWSLWWQQYSYWLWHLQSSTHFPQSGHPGASGATTNAGNSGSHDPQLPDYQQQWMQYYGQYPAYPGPHGQPAQPQGGAGPGAGYGPPQQQQNGFFVRIRMVTGVEVLIAPVWKRILAELIDMAIFALLLKAYLPEVDYRIPEIVFEGTDLWIDMENEDILDIKETLTIFVFSVLTERLLHSLMETLWTAVFSCTPGKWVMGLRVLRCSTASYTRTTPGQSVRIEPGTRLPFFLALIRALFKSIVSLICPLIVFFFVLNKGRTRYDELTQSAVVDIRSLYRPVYANRRPHVQVG